MEYNYAIDILERELCLLNKALIETKAFEKYPESYKDRKKKIKQIEEAIGKLKR